MRYQSLPNTDIKVSVIAMGCWALSGDTTWGPQDEQASIAAVHAALDHGINFFDTAEAYGAGLSERVLGKALADRRDRAVVASKVIDTNLAPADLVAACERSLENLGTDHIDLYQIHWPSRTVPLTDSWAALEKLRAEGKIRAIGVSNFGVGDLTDVMSYASPVTNQAPYSLLTRAIEYEILPMCIERGIGVLCYSPLAWGLLTGKYADADEVPAGRARSRHFSAQRPQTRHGQDGCEAQTFAAIDAVRRIARSIGRPMSELATAWLLHQRGVTSVLTGIRKPSQAVENAKAADLRLDDAVLSALDDATQPVKKALGPDPDLWEDASRSRYR